MALNIKDPTTDRLARELATLTGQPITTALREAIEARIGWVQARQRSNGDSSRAVLDQIAARGRARTVLDTRTPEDVIGYDEDGLPT